MDYYDVFPRIVPADKVSEVRIRPRYKHALFPEVELMQVVCNPFDGLNPDGKYGPDADAEKKSRMAHGRRHPCDPRLFHRRTGT